MLKILYTIFIYQRYEGVEPYIYDLQSKCIALCNISLWSNYTLPQNTIN